MPSYSYSWLLVSLRYPCCVCVCCVVLLTHFTEQEQRVYQRSYLPTSGLQTMRPPGVPGQRRGPEPSETQEVRPLRRGEVLLPGALRRALACARSSVPRAAAEVRPPEVREPSRNQVSPVRRSDVLLRGAQARSLVGAQEQVHGAPVDEMDREVDRRVYLVVR